MGPTEGFSEGMARKSKDGAYPHRGIRFPSLGVAESCFHCGVGVAMLGQGTGSPREGGLPVKGSRGDVDARNERR